MIFSKPNQHQTNTKWFVVCLGLSRALAQNCDKRITNSTFLYVSIFLPAYVDFSFKLPVVFKCSGHFGDFGLFWFHNMSYLTGGKIMTINTVWCLFLLQNSVLEIYSNEYIYIIRWPHLHVCIFIINCEVSWWFKLLKMLTPLILVSYLLLTQQFAGCKLMICVSCLSVAH